MELNSSEKYKLYLKNDKFRAKLMELKKVLRRYLAEKGHLNGCDWSSVITGTSWTLKYCVGAMGYLNITIYENGKRGLLGKIQLSRKLSISSFGEESPRIRYMDISAIFILDDIILGLQCLVDEIEDSKQVESEYFEALIGS